MLKDFAINSNTKIMGFVFVFLGCVICDPKASFEPNLNILVPNINAFRSVVHDHEKTSFNGFCYINLYKYLSP